MFFSMLCIFIVTKGLANEALLHILHERKVKLGV